MAYTAQQQAQIDAAKAKFDAAGSALDSAKNDALVKLISVNNCNCGKGKNMIGKCTPLTTSYSFPDKGDPKDCIEGPHINKCRTDCCRKSTCKTRVREYNDSIDKYEDAQEKYDKAKEEYDTVLENIGTEVANDPQNQLELATATADAEAEGKTLKTKWLIFGILAVVLILGIGFFYFKVIKK